MPSISVLFEAHNVPLDRGALGANDYTGTVRVILVEPLNGYHSNRAIPIESFPTGTIRSWPNFGWTRKRLEESEKAGSWYGVPDTLVGLLSTTQYYSVQCTTLSPEYKVHRASESNGHHCGVVSSRSVSLSVHSPAERAGT